MTVTKEMIEAFSKSFWLDDEPVGNDLIWKASMSQLADMNRCKVEKALNAALSAQPAPAVLAAAPQPAPQPLEWDCVIDGGMDRVAKTVIGEYVVSVDHPNAGGTHYLWVAGKSDGDEHHSEYRTMNAAKAAAQADYEQRILSALTTPPAAKQENERLREMIMQRDVKWGEERVARDAAEARVKAVEADASVLMAQLDAIQEATGHRLEGEDAVLVEAIRAALKGGEAFPQPRRKDGEEPCGECHIQPGETCDICGAASTSLKVGEV